MEYAPTPATSCPRVPWRIGAAFGEGATSLSINGKPHAGVLFHKSSTVGLLFRVNPYTQLFPPNLRCLPYRMSVLSMVKWSPWVSYVTCMKLPRCVDHAPERNR